ncbi:MAG: 50S ribosomal protein L10, partial [Candidatus Omnitrophica bacterium]|nr:50S ribosomal protein L10 [Candidatus Omnitrophota bacterium]
QIDDLRKKMRGVGARVYVSKNRIAQIALKDVKQEALAEHVENQTAFIWSNGDSVAISKALLDFVKGRENVLVKGGVLSGSLLQKEDVKRLSDLPSREVLLAQLLSTILSPLTRLAGAMNAKSQELLSILKQLSEKKGGN